MDATESMAAISRALPDAERRRLLTAISGAGVVAIAGCTDDDPAEDDVATYEVVYLDHDETVAVRADEDLLAPALETGVEIPYSCEVGTGGQCTGDTTAMPPRSSATMATIS
ncbi:hypothetical protein C495_11544 [Natronorubrum sulfidifaciens JCM 14089]|uniref:2Fe-2S ferredoxin-type domain-containing protein n=2 Tax=Natronorubrum sulfidifaciens TaxID=388259 RepID=L9W5B4_9EURY|nr:hypothetical protein C495_11544 [Natronorubrum sulfidifaciens JCM 14089]